MGGLTDKSGQEIAGLYSPFLGQLQQLAQNVPARSNCIDLGLTGLADGALAATGVGAFVPIRVVPGDKFSRISVPIGATAGATMTHQFAALYAGTGAAPALLGQSKDTTNAAIAEKALKSWTLESEVEATLANAPFGFLYALVAITAATVPTAAVAATPVGVNYQWVSGAPLFLSGTAGSGLNGTAAATIAAPAAKAVAPIVILQ